MNEQHGGWPWEGENDQLKAIMEADPLVTTQEVAKEIIDHSMVVQHLKQTGKLKKLDKLVSHEPKAIKKKSSFWSVIFSYSIQQQTIS